jgi:iron complex transport system substrate-binding protein
VAVFLRDFMKRRFALVAWAAAIFALNGCSYRAAQTGDTLTVTDQLGRSVTVPRPVTRVAALHHFGGRIVFALGQRDRLVEQSLYGREAEALAGVDPKFAAMPKTQAQTGHAISYESLIALRPQCAFVYASFDRSEMQQLEEAGIKVIAVKGETLDESFEAAMLVARILDCEERGEEYIRDCRRLVALVQDRIRDLQREKRLRVIFTGPKSIYTIATGEMLQNEMLELAGAVNAGASLKGFWSDVSPEQVAAWNPDAIFIGSSLATYGVQEVLHNSQFRSVKAVRDGNVHVFPSNIGWWDYPAPQCVLGVVWTAKTLYPERFRDVDILGIAEEFSGKYLGHTFTSMGGKL